MDQYTSSAMMSPVPSRFSSPSGASKATTPNSMSRTVNRSHLSAFTPIRPVLTPGRTPRGSQGHVLLSPSRTITESLNALASETAQQLEEIWDDVGYNPKERADQLSDLLVKFRDQCEQKINEEQAVAETFRQTISDSKEEIKTLAKALKALIDPKQLQENNGQTLTDELANLETTLDCLRADANAAISDLKASQDQLIEFHEALGLDLAEKWLDIESDLTIQRREEFRQKVDEMRDDVATRSGAIIQLVKDCQHLMNDLGIDGQTSDSILDRRIAGSLVRSKDSSFILASKLETDSCTGISSHAMDELTNRVSQLSNEKRRRKTLLQEMGAEIAMLWEQLQIPPEDQRAFTDSVKGLGMDTITKGQEELSRLKALKGEMLGNLIEDARTTIRELWDQTNATESVRMDFSAITIEDEAGYDDKLLDEHEEYIRVLETRLEQMKPILRIIERREDILRERMQYEELQKDSDRLKQRGAAMAKQLMEEEKMARRIKKDLPRLTKLLKEKLNEWKDSSGEDFQYKGELYVDAIARQDEEWTQYKAAELQNKLKKKQEEQEFEENKYLGKGAVTKKKKTTGRPLGDSNTSNVRASSRMRSRLEDKKPLRATSGNTRSRMNA